MIKKPIKKWARKIKKSFNKKFPLSLINIIIILAITYTAIGFVAGYGIIPFLGYLLYSIVNLNKLIEKPWKSAFWALIYIACAIIFEILLGNALPLLKKGTGASIFSGLILAIILLYLWVKVRKLK